MSETVVIPLADFERARRRMCRNIGAAIVRAMAETDSDADAIAARLGISPNDVKWQLNRLIDGAALTLDQISDLLLAMGAELEFSIRRIPTVRGAKL